MPLARRAAVALAVMGAGVLAYAVPATATGSDRGSGRGCSAEEEASQNLEWEFEGQTSTPTGKAWIKLKDGHRLCNRSHADIVLSTYHVPDTWDGAPFPGGNNSAVPQHVIGHDTGKLNGHQRLYLQVPVPDCGNVQIDLYVAPTQDDVDSGGTARFIAGFLFSMDNGHSAPHGKPGYCAPPTTTPPPTTTEAPPTTTEAPPTTTEAPPTTTEAPPTTTEAPPTTTEAPPTTTEAPPTTTEAPPTTTEAPPSATPTTTIPPIAAPIPVLPQQPPRLAETGSNSTLPLIGLGSVMLVAGIGLSLAGRRRRPTEA